MADLVLLEPTATEPDMADGLRAEAAVVIRQQGAAVAMRLRHDRKAEGGVVRRPPLTFEQHEALAVELKRIRDRLQRLMHRAALTYGKTSETGRKALKVVTPLDTLRYAMDGEARRDLGQRYDPRLYFPGPTADSDATDEETFRII